LIVNNAVTGKLDVTTDLPSRLAVAVRIKATQNDPTQAIFADVAVPETITFPL
jgi:hypothetical protein